MSLVNTTSVRESLDQLRSDYERMSIAGQLSDEATALFTGLITLVEVLVSIFLERTTKKHIPCAEIFFSLN